MLTEADLSIVVCTRERPEMLRDALASIVANSDPATEVIVVDSASTTSATREVALAAGCRYVRSDIKGLSIARNLGLRTAEREIVVYTDDDCLAAVGWLKVLPAHFDRPEVGSVSGLMRHDGNSSAAPPAREYRTTVQGLDSGHGAIMAFRRDLAVSLGGFDDVLGAGRELAGAEDLDMFCRVLAAGSTVVNDPACEVIHMNTREGEDYRRLLRGYGLGLGALANKWLRLRLRVGLALSARIFGRAVRQVLHRGGDEVLRSAHRAQLAGTVQGFWRATRMRLTGTVFLDANPPSPIRLSEPE